MEIRSLVSVTAQAGERQLVFTKVWECIHIGLHFVSLLLGSNHPEKLYRTASVSTTQILSIAFLTLQSF
jgi:hypothetical protein